MNDEVCEWQRLPRKHRWLYDKLLLSDALGYVCGPVGQDVPIPDWYIVRPITNINGMGEGATLEWIESDTDRFPAGHFWCEVFTGPHLSVDYRYGGHIRVVEGFKGEGVHDPQKWYKWALVDTQPPSIPRWLEFICETLPMANLEFIGGNVIEFQARNSTDFRWGNAVAYPVYDINEKPPFKGAVYVDDPDFNRMGFWVDNP